MKHPSILAGLFSVLLVGCGSGEEAPIETVGKKSNAVAGGDGTSCPIGERAPKPEGVGCSVCGPDADVFLDQGRVIIETRLHTAIFPRRLRYTRSDGVSAGVDLTWMGWMEPCSSKTFYDVRIKQVLLLIYDVESDEPEPWSDPDHEVP